MHPPGQAAARRDEIPDLPNLPQIRRALIRTFLP
jgi:hypothetical protein